MGRVPPIQELGREITSLLLLRILVERDREGTLVSMLSLLGELIQETRPQKGLDFPGGQFGRAIAWEGYTSGSLGCW